MLLQEPPGARLESTFFSRNLNQLPGWRLLQQLATTTSAARRLTENVGGVLYDPMGADSSRFDTED